MSPFVPQWLNQMGQGAQGMTGLPTLPGANRQRSLADVLAETMAAQRQFEQGEALQGQDYIDNSGIGGALLMGLQGFVGSQKASKAEKQLADLLRERFDLENADAEKSARAQMEAEDRDYERQLRLIEAREAARARGKAPDWKSQAIEDLSPEQRQQAALISLGLAPRAGSGPAPERVQFGAPMEVMGPDGRPMLVRPRSDGGLEPVQGFRPKAENEKLSVQEQKELFAQNMRQVSADGAMAIIDELDAMAKRDVGGRITGNLPYAQTFSEDIEAYNSGTAALVDEITRLRRVPGIGTQSNLDLEQALRAIPDAGSGAETRRKALDRLRSVVARIREESEAASERVGGAGARARPASLGGQTGDPLIDKYL